MDWKKIAEALSLKVEDMKDNEAAEALVLSSVASMKKELETEKEKNKTLELSAKPKTPDPTLVKLLSKNRNMELDALVATAKITPAVKKDMEAMFVSSEALALSLSRGDDSSFDKLVDALKKNDVVELGEKSRAQLLELSNKRTDHSSALIKDAEKRAEEVK